MVTEAWVRLVGSGVPKDEATRVVGLDMKSLPDGEITYMPMNLIPVAWGEEVESMPPSERDEDDEQLLLTEGDDGEDGSADAEDDDRDTDKAWQVVRCGECDCVRLAPVPNVKDHYRCTKCGALTRMRPKQARPDASNTIVRRV